MQGKHLFIITIYYPMHGQDETLSKGYLNQERAEKLVEYLNDRDIRENGPGDEIDSLHRVRIYTLANVKIKD